MNNNYEVTVLLDEDVSEEQIKALSDFVAEYGKVIKFDDDGVKRLAYAIGDKEYAHYLFYVVETNEEKAEKLTNDLYERSLRHLVVKEILRSKK